MQLDRRALLMGSALTVVGSAFAAPARAAAPAAIPKATAAGQVFKVGDFVAAAIHEGAVANPMPKGFIRNLPDEDTGKAFAAVGLPADKLSISFTPFVVATKDHLVLFDAGFGDNGGPSTGRLVANLAALGIKPGDIDTLVFSHFHGDHITGARSKAGDLTFPNAKIMVPEPEWAYWMDDAIMGKAPEAAQGGFKGVRRVFAPVADKVEKFAWGKEIVPGVTAVQADGHTPGHTAFHIASGKDQLMYVADIVNNPAIFARNPDWKVMFDMDADKAVATRKAILDRAAADKIRVAFYHGAFPSTGYAIKAGTGYEIVPAFVD